MFNNIKYISVVFCAIFFAQSNAQEVDGNLVSKGLNAYSNNFDIGTARYTAMGGSMGALGGDVSAINTNPAASGVFIKSNLTGTLSLKNNANEATLGNTTSNDESNLNFNQLGGVININTNDEDWKMVNIGILYDREDLDNRIDYSANSNIISYDFDALGMNADKYSLAGYTEVLEGSKEKVTLNIGTNYKNTLYLGGSVNFHSADLLYDQQYRGQLDGTTDVFAYNNISYPYAENSTGVSFGVGAIAKINQYVRLGAAYHSKVNWNDIYTEYNEYYYDDVTGLIDSEVGLAVWDQDDARSASKLALSGAVVLGKNLAINVDYITHFTKDIEYRPNSEYTGTNTFINDNTKNASELKIGGEYRIKKFRIRGGFSQANTPIEQVSLATAVTDESFNTGNWIDGNGNAQSGAIQDLFAGDSQTLSAGVGYDFGSFYLDFAFQNRTQEYKTLLGGVYVDPGFFPLDFQTTVGEVKNTQNNYLLSFGWNF